MATASDRILDSLDPRRRIWSDQAMKRREFNLTRSEASMLDIITKAGKDGAHRESVMGGLYSCSGRDWPQDRVLDAFAHKIRLKLAAHNHPFTIKAVKGFGWYLVENAPALTIPAEFMAILRKQRYNNGYEPAANVVGLNRVMASDS